MRPGDRVERLTWIDTSRGIGIVLVVFGHVISGVAAVNLVSDEGSLRAVYDAIYTFHMPLFFVLAGWTFQPRPRIVRRRAAQLLYPYVVWSVLQGGLAVVLPGAVNAHLTPAELAVRLVTNPIGQFWFLPVLFLITAIAVVAGSRLPPVAAGLFFVAFCPPLFDHIGFIGRSVCRNIPFFALGSMRWRPRSLWWLTGIVIVWVCRGWQGSRVLYLCPAFFGIAATVVLGGVVNSAMVRQLGKWSLVIYLAHVLAAAAARGLLLRLGLHDGMAHVTLGTIAGLGGPAILASLRDHGHAEPLFEPRWPTRERLAPAAAPSQRPEVPRA